MLKSGFEQQYFIFWARFEGGLFIKPKIRIMKKIILVFLCLLSYIFMQAQLRGTKWRATIKGDNPRNVIIDFKDNTMDVYAVFDSAMIETMTYTVDGQSFSVKKIDGQSDCDNTVTGKYKFRIVKDSMYVSVLSDPCNDRSTALNATKWIKWKNHREVKLGESVLKQYVGVYELDAGHRIYITLENGRLQMEGPDNNLPKSPLIAEGNNRFFIKIAGVELDFIKDVNGKVIKIISYEEKNYELKKVK